MRDRIRILALAVLMAGFGIAFLGIVQRISDSSAHAATQATNYKQEVGISGQTITNPVAATFLTVPAGAEHAWITVKGNPACWGANVDGTAPTATSGGEWPAGMTFQITNDRLYLQTIRVINCAEGATTVKVYYGRSRRFND